MASPEDARQLRGLSNIYGPDIALKSYIETGAPYSNAVQKYLDAGTDSETVINMMSGAFEIGMPFQYIEFTAPEANDPGDFVTNETTGELVSISGKPAVVRWSRPEESLKEAVNRPRQGIVGRAMGLMDKFMGATIEAEESGTEDSSMSILEGTIADGSEAYPFADERVQHPLTRKGLKEELGGKVVKPAIAYVSKGAARAMAPTAPMIEAFINATETGKKPPDDATIKKFYSMKMRSITDLRDMAGMGFIPPPEEFSDEFISKMISEPEKYSKYLFLMSEGASSVHRTGEISYIFPPRKVAESPLHLLAQTGFELFDDYILDEIKKPENWQYYLAAEMLGEVVFRVGVPALKSKLVDVAESIPKTTLGRGGRWVSKKLSTGYHPLWRAQQELLDRYDVPIIKRLLFEEKEVPMEDMVYLINGGASDGTPFLEKNPMVSSFFERMRNKHPEVIDDILRVAKEATDAGTIGDVKYNMPLPVGVHTKRFVGQVPDNISKRTPQQAIYDVIGAEDGLDTSAVVRRLGNKGMDTLDTSATDDSIQIVLRGTADVTDRLSNAPFSVSTQTHSVPITPYVNEDIIATTIDVPKNRIGEAIKFIENMDSVADDINLTKPLRQQLAEFDDFVKTRHLAPDEIESLRSTLIEPEARPVPPTIRRGQPAVPPGDVDAAGIPPVSEGPPAPEPVAPSVSKFKSEIPARVRGDKQIWQMTPEEWLMTREMPADITRVRKMPAFEGDWNAVRATEIKNYLKRLRELVVKYSPERLGDFDAARKLQIALEVTDNFTRENTAGAWQKYMQFIHRQWSKINFQDVMEHTGITDSPRRAINTYHRQVVQAAREAGEEIPGEVLALYPDIAAMTPGVADDLGIPITTDTIDELARTMDVPPPPPRDLTPQPVPAGDVPSELKLHEPLRQLGWEDNQIQAMSYEESRRVLTQNLTPDRYKVRGNQVKHVVEPDVPDIHVDDLKQGPLAMELSEAIDNESMRLLRTMKEDLRGANSKELLTSLADNIPEVKRLLDANEVKNWDGLVDDVLNKWHLKHIYEGTYDHANRKYVLGYMEEEYEDMMKAYYDTYDKSFKRAINRYTKQHEHEIPELWPEGMRRQFAAGRMQEDDLWKKYKSATKHRMQSHWNRSMNPEGSFKLYSGYRKLSTDKPHYRNFKKDYPQFFDSYRTDVMTIPEKSTRLADLEMGFIMGDLTKAERQHVMNILGLRNFLANRMDDIPIARGWTEELLMENLDKQMKGATERVMHGVARFDDIMRIQGHDLVVQNKIPLSSLKSNFFPNQVLKYTPDHMLANDFRASLSATANAPMRMYTKTRMGTPEDIVLSENAIRMYLTLKHGDDLSEAWTLKQLAARDLWDNIGGPNLTPEQLNAERLKIFGPSKNNPRIPAKPQPGKEYFIPGGKDPYVYYQFKPGNMYYKQEGVNRSAFAQVLEEWLLMSEHDSELLASQIDLNDLAKGKIPDVLAKMLDEAGERGGPAFKSFVAVGRKHRGYVIEKPIAARLNAFRYNTPVTIPGMYSIMAATQQWKRITLQWAGIPFQLNNLFGDAENGVKTFGVKWMDEIIPATRTLWNIHRPEGHKLPFGALTDFDKYSYHLGSDLAVLESGLFAAELEAYPTLLKRADILHMIDRASGMREAVLRLAAFRHQLKYYDAHGTWNAVGFKSRMFDKAGKQLFDGPSGSAFLVRKTFVDYADQTANFNQAIRGFAAPFATFYKDSAKEWGHLLAEFPGGTGKALTMMLGPKIASEIWIQTAFPEVSAAIGPLRRGFVWPIYTWSDDDMPGKNKALVLYNKSPSSMALETLGLDRLQEKYQLVKDGYYGKDMNKALKRAASEQWKDMTYLGFIPLKGPVRLTEKLLSPIYQGLKMLVTNRHPHTNKQILSNEEMRLPKDEQFKRMKSALIGVVFTPLGAYMQDKRNQNPELIDQLGLDVKGGLGRTLLTGPLNIGRAMGLMVIDLNDPKRRAMQFAKMDTMFDRSRFEADLTNMWYKWEGKSTEMDKFLSQRKVIQLLAENSYQFDDNIESLKSILRRGDVLERFYEAKKDRATTAKERNKYKGYAKFVAEYQAQKALQQTGLPARGALQERLREIKTLRKPTDAKIQDTDIVPGFDKPIIIEWGEK